MLTHLPKFINMQIHHLDEFDYKYVDIANDTTYEFSV